MNLVKIKDIRNGSDEERLSLLVQHLFRKKEEPSPQELLRAEEMLHRMQRAWFSVSPSCQLIFSNDPSGSYVIYDFLRDYFGLGGKPPLDVISLRVKYPRSYRGAISAEGNSQVLATWYEAMVDRLLEFTRTAPERAA